MQGQQYYDQKQQHQAQTQDDSVMDRSLEVIIDPSTIHLMGNTRVFIGSLPPKASKEQIRKLLSPYGDLEDCYVNTAKNFAMVRFRTREQAYRAQVCLHCTTYQGRFLIVRLAPHPASIWIGDLGLVVSNEVLFSAFSRFGQVEKAIVVRDSRGRSCGYGIVEFVRKGSARIALERCQKKPFLLTRSPHPVRVEQFKFKEEDVGLISDDVNHDFHYFALLREEDELSIPPRFADEPGTTQGVNEMANRWMQLYEEEEKAKIQRHAEFAEKRRQLEEEMKIAILEEEKKVLEMRYQQERLETELAEIQNKIQQSQKPQYYAQQHHSEYPQQNQSQYSSPHQVPPYQQHEQLYDDEQSPYQYPPQEQEQQPWNAYMEQGYQA